AAGRGPRRRRRRGTRPPPLAPPRRSRGACPRAPGGSAPSARPATGARATGSPGRRGRPHPAADAWGILSRVEEKTSRKDAKPPRRQEEERTRDHRPGPLLLSPFSSCSSFAPLRLCGRLFFSPTHAVWRMWQFLYFLPEPHGQGSLRPTFWPRLRIGSVTFTSPVEALVLWSAWACIRGADSF